MIREESIDRPKKTWEVFTVSMNFKNNIDTGETIDSGNSSVVADLVVKQGEYTDVTGSIVGNVSVTGTTLIASIKGGVSGNKYKIRFRAYVSTSKKLEEVVNLKVQD